MKWWKILLIVLFSMLIGAGLVVAGCYMQLETFMKG
jgi:hypothetical protein